MSVVIEFDKVSRQFVRRQNASTIQERFMGLIRGLPPAEAFWAVRDVSFAVEEGQSIGLVGHNGAGKSTILKLMTRVLEPTSGRVTTQGRIAALLELGSGFHPELSGRENVFLYGSLMGFGRKEMQRKLPEIIEFSEIGPFLDTEVKHYSSGMYTRLAFAVATAVDPDILITDEVLAVGDETFQRKCIDRIYGFRRAGKTIVFVSHALDVVRSLCDVAVWLDHGEMKAYGEAGKVVDAYLADVNERERAEFEERLHSEDDDQIRESRMRRGSREVEITRVQLLDAQGRERITFRTHEPLTIRIHYLAHQRIERPVFGVGINHESGPWLTGPNTGFDKYHIPFIEGAGIIDYHIPRLPFLGGRYLVSASATDSTQLYEFDVHDRMYPLVIHSDGLSQRYGMVFCEGNWSWHG
ncbi:MAG TPA: ABC transporter ATP-binding protein [Chloroflexus aurantiacus]|jgi:lipopolysaccharide transport system ATP-binding protein|uniref:ABC transporter related n=1 Tax=Chloroflexus aurantiacus (strain ATCC 29366 / DSM 635 / J-10-fl) TaxID=324602 RepID=A9WCG5_CHLAA|nr:MULTISPECIES: ABC transporter ATP-binding protein [Chloroflexus]ABY34956.1 ABC transporter related [Chloroflexus aurantiacus J-10-fl]RMG46042.1 MAG: ABC transporter ATP-binding protein [Chloroflexota bacterium]HBW68281.1 ABC transporter ATP-binding protein [Chloroflexus aurantiacus]